MDSPTGKRILLPELAVRVTAGIVHVDSGSTAVIGGTVAVTKSLCALAVLAQGLRPGLLVSPAQ